MSKEIVNTMASKISLDIDTTSLYDLKQELKRTTKEWNNSAEVARIAGNYHEANVSKISKEKDALKILNATLEKSQKELKNVTGSTKKDATARKDWEDKIRDTNIEIAKHNNYLEKAQQKEKLYKSGILEAKDALKSAEGVNKSYVDRLKAEGNTIKATKAEYSGLKDTLEHQKELYAKQKKYIEELSKSRSEDRSAINKQIIENNKLGTSIAKTKDELGKAKSATNPFKMMHNAIHKTNSEAEKTPHLFKSIVGANLATNVIQATWQGITNHIGGAIKAGMEYNEEQQKMGATWQTLRGTVSKSNEMVKTINDISVATGQATDTVDELEQGFYHLHSNKKESDEMTKSMLNMSDAVGLNKQQINAVTQDMVNGLSRGKANAGMLNQISQYFPMFREQLAKTETKMNHGKKVTVADLSAMAKAGKISSKDIEKTFESLGNGKYSKAAENMLSTVVGASRVIKARVPALLGDIEKPLMKAKNPIFLTVSKWVSDKKTDKEFKKVGSSLSEGMSTITKAFAKVFKAKDGTKFLDNMVKGFSKGITKLSGLIVKHAGDITNFFKSTKTAGIDSFKLMTGATSLLAKAMFPLLEFMAKHNKVFTPLIAGVIAYKKVVEPLAGLHLVKGIGKVSDAMKDLSKNEKIATATQDILNASQKAMLAVGIVGIIVAIGVALTELYKHNKKFRDFINGIVNGAKNMAGKIGKWFGKAFKAISKVFGGVVKSAKGIGKKIGNGFKDAPKTASKYMSKLSKDTKKTVSWMQEHTPKQFKNMWKDSGKIFKSGTNVLKSYTKYFKDFFTGNWKDLGKDVVKIGKSWWKLIKNLFKMGYDFLNDLTGGRLGKLFKIIKDVMGTISKYWGIAWKGIKDVFSDVWNGIKSIAEKAVNGLIGIINGAIGGIDKVIKAFGGKEHAIGTIPKVKFASGTGALGGQRREITKPTHAVLNDGSDSPETGNQEGILTPDGNIYPVQGRNTETLLLPGMEVLNAREMNMLMQASPVHFASGTGWFDSITKTVGGIAGSAWDGIKGAGKWVGKVFGSLKDKINAIKNFVAHPIKSFDAFFGKVAKGGGVMHDITSGLMNKTVKTGEQFWKSLWNAANDALGSGGGGSSAFLQKAMQVSKGKPYVWGATGPSSFDCSGLVMYTLKKFGIDYPHFSGAQYSKSSPVSESNARPGDLVFYGSGGNQHVGIYSSANKFWSAQSPSAHPNIGFGPIHGFGEKFAGIRRVKGLHDDVKKDKSTKSQKFLSKVVGNGFFKWIKKHLAPLMEDAGGSGGIPAGDAVGRWKNDVKKALGMLGLSTSSSMVAKVLKQINTESGGNPNVVGGTDGLNDGRATGLMQVKPGTFKAYKLSGHGNIKDGFDNMLAGLNYAKHRYGKALSFLGNGHGYANGGLVNKYQIAQIAENNKPEMIIPLAEDKRPRGLSLLHETASRMGKRLSNNDNSQTNSSNLEDKVDVLIQMFGQLLGLNGAQLQAIKANNPDRQRQYHLQGIDQSMADFQAL